MLIAGSKTKRTTKTTTCSASDPRAAGESSRELPDVETARGAKSVRILRCERDEASLTTAPNVYRLRHTGGKSTWRHRTANEFQPDSV